MEAFSLYFLSLLAIVVSISLRFFSQRYNPNRSNNPPGTFGFPVVGETLRYFSSGPEKFMQQRMEKYSEEVFATSLLGEKVAVVCGAAGNKFLLFTANSHIDPWFPSAIVKFRNWVDSPGQSVKDIVSKDRTFLHNEILKPESLRQYVTIMDSLTRQHIKTYWDPFKVVKIYPLSKKYALSLACRLLLGVEDDNEVQTISDSFYFTLQGFISLPINLPGTAYYRAVKEMEKLRQQFLNIIAKKKKTVLENRERASSDVLSRTLMSENSHLMSDSEIGLYLLTLMLPSYQATSATITFVLKYLAELPDIYAAVYEEHMEISKSKGPQELLNWEDVKKMKYSWNVICEAMRLTPPGLGTFREAKTDINFAGFTIPKGWKIHWSPFTTNKNPKYFPEPETFDPTRHDGDGPTPCAFLPFSAGSRMCPGKEYAKFLILVYIHNVVTKFKLEKVIQDEKIYYRAGPVPANGLPLRLLPH